MSPSTNKITDSYINVFSKKAFDDHCNDNQFLSGNNESVNYYLEGNDLIKIKYIPQLSESPVSDESYRETLFQRVLSQVQKDINIIINGKNFTNNIIQFNSNNMPEYSDIRILEGKTYIVLPEGIDGVIMNMNQDSNSSIVMPVADCAAINFINKNQGVYGTLHAGYKGAAKGIIDELFNRFQNDSNFAKNTKFDLSPMAGDDFQLPKKNYDEIFGNYLRSKSLDPHAPRYYLEVPSKITSNDNNSKIKVRMCNFSLKNIILDILEYYGVPKENIKFSLFETTDVNNDFSSFRLHSNFKAIQKEIKENLELGIKKLSPDIFNLNYFDKIIANPNYRLNINGRMASIIEYNKKRTF